MALVDRSLHFGLQNFMWIDEATDNETYDFNIFVNKKGTILILRTNKAGTSGRYWVGSGVVATVWGARETYTYTTPDQLDDQRV